MSKRTVLIHPTVFPSVSHFTVIYNAGKVIFEQYDHFEKQTYRNRYYIHGAHGKQLLTVPVKHSKSNRHRPTKDIEIANEFDWQRQHWKSIETAYRTSPYFEYYEDDIRPLFEQKFDKLIDFNIEGIKLIAKWLNIPLESGFTTQYLKQPGGVQDFRYLVDAKKHFEFKDKFETYFQVFSDRNGFLPDLSILDLMFMKGPETAVYLKQHAGLFYKD